MTASPSDSRRRRSMALLFATALVAGCGGGGADAGGPAPAPSGPSDAQRATAATGTANGNSTCIGIAPFYWEVGDSASSKVSGSVNGAGNATSYGATSVMAIASASKWLYGAYVVQKRNAVLTASDIKFLTFQSGYTNFSTCLAGQTVDGCVAYQSNGVHSDATDGKFSYGGGHMENHASQTGLGALGNAALAAEIRTQIGTDIGMSYVQPQPAGGVVSTPDDYARFLRKLLGGQLQIAAQLGSHAVCTNPSTCATAVYAPIPSGTSWHYSIGHWVEDDPVTGDGAFSSPGAFGFYPWVDASKRWYGIVARSVTNGYYESAQCGRLIRKAWVSGVAQ